MITRLMGDLIEGAINNLSDDDIDEWLRVGKKLQRYFKIQNLDDIAMGPSDYAPSDASHTLKFDEVVTDMGAHIPFAYERLDGFGTMVYFANDQDADDWEEAMIAKDNEGVEESLEVSDKLIAVDSKQKAYHQFLRGEKKLDAFKKEAEKADCDNKECCKELKEGYDSDLTMDEVASYIRSNYYKLDEINVDSRTGLWKDYDINYEVDAGFNNVPNRIIVSVDDDMTHSYREFRFAEYDDWMMCLDDAFSPETVEDLERLISDRLSKKFPKSLNESDGWDADTEEADRDNKYISFEDDDYSPMNDDRPEWEKDIEWADIYGGETSYCRKCHGKLEYDNDGDLACPECQPSRFERQEDDTVPTDWNDDLPDDFDFDDYWGNYPNDPMYDPADTSRDDGYGWEDDEVEESLGNFCAANIPINPVKKDDSNVQEATNEVDMNAYGDPEDDEF